MRSAVAASSSACPRCRAADNVEPAASTIGQQVGQASRRSAFQLATSTDGVSCAHCRGHATSALNSRNRPAQAWAASSYPGADGLSFAPCTPSRQRPGPSARLRRDGAVPELRPPGDRASRAVRADPRDGRVRCVLALALLPIQGAGSRRARSASDSTRRASGGPASRTCRRARRSTPRTAASSPRSTWTRTAGTSGSARSPRWRRTRSSRSRTTPSTTTAP
jgi:hypothetical protein